MLKVEALIRVAPISAHRSRPLSSNTGDKKGRSALWDLLQHHPDLPTGAECPQLPSESVQSTIFSFLEGNLIYWGFFPHPGTRHPSGAVSLLPAQEAFSQFKTKPGCGRHWKERPLCRIQPFYFSDSLRPLGTFCLGKKAIRMGGCRWLLKPLWLSGSTFLG